MGWFGVSAGQAETLLLTWSCENKVSACELATALVSDIYEGWPTGCSTEVLRHLEQHLRDLGNAKLIGGRLPRPSRRASMHS